MDINSIQNKLKKFVDERDWEQFHSPKNLIMAITSEVGELNDLFQWLTEEESKLKKDSTEINKVKEEIADIFIYLLRLADKLDIDIEKAIVDKMEINSIKYPVNLSKGNATKYNRRKEN